ncbi:alpha/beta fold hydrolase [Aegicerativicinus sediminis]|uniref:alpha/beta fold hydrolase n=1 Tax=Aegicerativicinus sediminis TaxID=2893202 RepID=UPI001E48E5B5|nr:alpha/beta fold hydrolase [Aegicerativicinus sediminis]
MKAILDKEIKKLYPFKNRYSDIGGHRIHYIDEGKGEPILFLHGNPSWSFYFRELIKTLSPDYRCIALDHIGMGLSDKPLISNYNYTLQQRVKDLTDFINAINLNEKFTLVAHDWGGIIGMSYARHNRENIKRLVLMNTVAFHLPKEKKLPFMLRMARTYLGQIAIQGFNAFNGGSTRIGVKRKKMSREVRRGYTAPYNSWKNRIGVMQFIKNIPVKLSDSGYGYIEDVQNHLFLFQEVPVLLIWGLKDIVFDEDLLNKWIEYLPHSEVHRYLDCGHYVLEDAPEEVTNDIIDFLKRTNG